MNDNYLGKRKIAESDERGFERDDRYDRDFYRNDRDSRFDNRDRDRDRFERDNSRDRDFDFDDRSKRRPPPVGIVQTTYDVPNEKVSIIIGKRGMVIQTIMQRSNCRIHVDSDQKADPRRVYVSGPEEGVDIAMSLIKRILVEDSPDFLLESGRRDREHKPSRFQKAGSGPGGDSPVHHGGPYAPRGFSGDSDEVNDQIFCPHAKVSGLIGPRGLVIGEIIKTTGCKVQIRQDGVPDGADRAVVFIGTRAQVTEARQLVQAVIKEGPMALQAALPHINMPNGALDVQIIEKDIAPFKVGGVIGGRGATLNEIMRLSGCKIFINQNFPEGQPHKVVYTGTSSQIENAKLLVEGIIDYGSDVMKLDPRSIAAGVQAADPRELARMGHPTVNAKPTPSGPGAGQDFGPLTNSAAIVHEITLYQSQVMTIIGPQGSGQQELQRRFRVQLSHELMPSIPGLPGDPVHRFLVTGIPEAIAAAITNIYKTLGVDDPNPALTKSYASGVSGHAPPAVQSYQRSTQPAAAQQQQGMPVESTSFAFGADGKAGLLESATMLGNGLQQQIAELAVEYTNLVLGFNMSNLNLITNKSGCVITLLRPGEDRNKPDKSGHFKLKLVGTSAASILASQMIQEILVNGISKLEMMPDVPISGGSSNNRSAGYNPAPSYDRDFRGAAPTSAISAYAPSNLQTRAAATTYQQFDPSGSVPGAYAPTAYSDYPYDPNRK